MYIDEYLFRNKEGKVEFAKRCGITYRMLFEILQGRDMKLTTAKKIELASNGTITIEELYEKITEKHLCKKVVNDEDKKEKEEKKEANPDQ